MPRNDGFYSVKNIAVFYFCLFEKPTATIINLNCLIGYVMHTDQRNRILWKEEENTNILKN